MQVPKETIKGILLGALLMLLLVLTTGGIQSPNDNILDSTTVSFRSVFASADGKVVYACDDDNVYRSTDGGDNWTVVLAKKEGGREHSSRPESLGLHRR